MEYFCDLCNYSTFSKKLYTKHIKTYKHQNKEIEKQRQYPYECKYCNSTFQKKYCFTRHINACVLKKDMEKLEYIDLLKRTVELEKKYELDVEKLRSRKKIDVLKEEIKGKNELVDTCKNHINDLENVGFKVVNGKLKGTSCRKFLALAYPDAPPISAIDNVLDLDDSFRNNYVKYVEEILWAYKNDNLCRFIGGLIVRHYIKSDPKLQSLWSSDASRVTYVTKFEENNEGSTWKVDKKGVRTGSIAVKPVLDMTKEYIREYINTINIGRTLTEIELSNEKMRNGHEIITDIEGGKLCEEITRYLSSFFFWNKKINVSCLQLE